MRHSVNACKAGHDAPLKEHADGAAATEHCDDAEGAHNASEEEEHNVCGNAAHRVSPGAEEHSTRVAAGHTPAPEEEEKAEQQHAPKPRT